MKQGGRLDSGLKDVPQKLVMQGGPLRLWPEGHAVKVCKAGGHLLCFYLLS